MDILSDELPCATTPWKTASHTTRKQRISRTSSPQPNRRSTKVHALFDADPQCSVQQWKMLVFGNRPEDHMGRDCLLSALLRDHRTTWFHKYLRRPSPWMQAIADTFASKSERRQALQVVVLHYLHKLHLARMLPAAIAEAQGGMEEYYRTLRRVWFCPPVGALMQFDGGDGRLPPVCGRPRLCPWCFARKVVGLHEHMQQTLLVNPEGKTLLLGKVDPFIEPMGGLHGQWHDYDWNEYCEGGCVRGHWGRYYGRLTERVVATRKELIQSLMDHSWSYKIGDGVVFHQLGSGQLGTGQRTFRHNLSLVGVVDNDAFLGLHRETRGEFTWPIRSCKAFENSPLGLQVSWLPFRGDDPQALRVALAGTSLGYGAPQLSGRTELARSWSQWSVELGTHFLARRSDVPGLCPGNQESASVPTVRVVDEEVSDVSWRGS